MKVCALLTASVLAATGSATALGVLPRNPPIEEVAAVNYAVELANRASPDAPNGYTPASVDCPSTRPAIRNASSLSPNETAWLEKRRPITISAMRTLLTRLNITGFDAGSYFDTHSSNSSALPNIGIAVSGGGYRALMTGAGVIAAFDDRTPNSTNAGHIGGLLQSATYLAGLSGGGWLVGSLYANNFTSVQSIVDTNPDQSGSLWQFSNSILKGPEKGAIQLLSTAEYYQELFQAVDGKAGAGFNTSLTDYWGRALSYQLINASDGGPAYTFSSIANDADFSSANTPMPILIANGRAPGQILIPGNTTIFEFNPYEMGTFDPTVFGFAPMRYVGSGFTEGMLPSNESCIRGFDNLGFVMGTSSSLFNQFILNLNTTTGVPQILKNALASILKDLGNSDNDIADWTPNPFYFYNNDTNAGAHSKRLTLVDGGEDLENIPLHPLIQPLRNVDVIFAVDSSADTITTEGPGWPNGTSLVATYQRSLSAGISNGTTFPAVPDQNTFVNLGLNTRPTFFGCNASNTTGNSPLVVYLPNSAYITFSNVSTFTLSYNNTQRNVIIENGYDVATRGNGTLDKNWPVCVGCAVLSRSFGRTNTTVPDICNQCFSTYCWDGTVNSTTPPPFAPSPVLGAVKLTSGTGKVGPSGAALLAAAAVAVGMMV